MVISFSLCRRLRVILICCNQGIDLNRRQFIALCGGGGALAAGLALGRRVGTHRQPGNSFLPDDDPFTLGLASGDPWSDSVVLWTRLAPDPDDPSDWGLVQRPIDVDWQTSSDPRMATVVREGTVAALPQRAHAVHVIVDGLRPGREYFYRFRCGHWLSPVARTKTAPSREISSGALEIAVASCQSWSAGYYTAHRHLAADIPDVVVFLGDYIYEYGISAGGDGRIVTDPMPAHLADETVSLERYRAQYAWYKRDVDLQAAHQVAPWIATWDDHEVDDNYAADVASDPATLAQFRARRAAAYQAYWEHLPLRVPPPAGAAMTMHRRFQFGPLATFHVLDTRQYRSDQIAGDAWQRPKPERASPTRTMLGPRQQRWLADGLAASTSTWDVVAQQVIASRLDVDAGDGTLLNADTWDGYPVAQRQLYGALQRGNSPVVLTGDLHAAYAFDVKASPGDVDAPTIAVEFATTSISSGGDGSDLSPTGRRFLAANPHLHYASQRRGYLRCRLRDDAMVVDFRTVPYVAGDPNAPVVTDRTFVVEAESPALHAA
jgi:alkaline phosphatase D